MTQFALLLPDSGCSGYYKIRNLSSSRLKSGEESRKGRRAFHEEKNTYCGPCDYFIMSGSVYRLCRKSEEAGDEANNVANEQNQGKFDRTCLWWNSTHCCLYRPNVLGYYPEMNSTDQSWTMPALECLMTISEDRNWTQLAESMVEDPENKTITFKLRRRQIP